MQRFAVALVIAVMTAVTAAAALAGSNMLDPHALAHARVIKAEVSARYVRQGGPRLAVTEASSTAVIDSYQLLTPDLQGLRVVPADNGIYYAICPVRATCPYPSSRTARAASAFAPRRQALELALRTFLETSATVAVVSLPTRDYVFFLVERDELAAAVDMTAAGHRVGWQPGSSPRSLRAADRRRDHSAEALRAARPRADGGRPGRARRSAALARGSARVEHASARERRRLCRRGVGAIVRP